MNKISRFGPVKPYITPTITSPEIVAVVPLAAIAATTAVQMFGAGLLVGGAAAGAGALASKAMGFSDLKKTVTLLPVE